MYIIAPRSRSALGLRIALLFALALVCTSEVRAQSSTLLDTFGPGNTFAGSGTTWGTAATYSAVQFIAPQSGNTSLISIDMALAVSGTVSSAQIGIFNDFGVGLPQNSPIALANIPGPLSGSLSFTTITFPAGTILTTGHSYWAAPIITGTGSVLWGQGLTGTTNIAYYNGAAWSHQTLPDPVAVRVTVVPASTPCCNARGTGGCILLLTTDCNTVGGVVVRDQGTCAVTSCNAFIYGICCHGAVCNISTQEGCGFFAPPGRFYGYGMACTPAIPGGPSPCCPAAFDNSGSITIQDLFDFLAAWFAGCP